MNHLKTYTQERTKLAALGEQQNNITTKLRGFALAQEAAQTHLKETAERADTMRGKAMRGGASDEELAESDAESDMLFAKAQLDDLRNDERICRGELSRLQLELLVAQRAVSGALDKLCVGIAEQLGETLAKDKKLRAVLVDIYVAYSASTNASLGSVAGGSVHWGAVLESLFPMPTDAEYESAYARFQSQLR